MRIRLLAAALTVPLLALTVACGSTTAAAPPKPVHATLLGVYDPNAPKPPAGYTQTYARNFATTPSLGDWVVQPGAGATVKFSSSFGMGIEMPAVDQWAEIISSDAVITQNAFVQALVYIPSGSGQSGNGQNFPAGSTANWPAFWTTGSNWPADGEIDMLEGQTGQSCEQTHYGTSGEINSNSFCHQGNATGTGWTTVSMLRTGENVTVWYGGDEVGTVPLPTTANEQLIFQNQSYSATGGCPQCFGPTVLGNNSTAWLSRVTVYSGGSKAARRR